MKKLITKYNKAISNQPSASTFIIFGTIFVLSITLLVLGNLLAFSNEPKQFSWSYPILLFNLIPIIVLGIYLGVRIWFSLFAKKRNQSAPMLHRRFVTIFSLSALTPAIIVGVFSTSLISQNINDLFGSNVRSNMESAREILDGYVKQELTELAQDASIVVKELSLRRQNINSRISFTADLQIISRVRDLDAIYIMNNKGYVLSRVESPISPSFEIPLKPVFQSLKPNDIAFIQRDDVDYLIAVTPIDGFDNLYLFIGRVIRSNNRVLSSLSGVAKASQAIDRFNADQKSMNKIFFLTFLEAAILLLFTSVWLGLSLANRIINPLGTLINASEKVRLGDMTARVEVDGNWGEISDLGSAFNKMTHQLSTQRDDLVREHDLSEQRRQFSEAVLSGVRAGVIGLNQAGKITIMNQSAKRLLSSRDIEMEGSPISQVLPEFLPAFIKAKDSIQGSIEDQVNFKTINGIRNFDLSVNAYSGSRKDTGWVMTFDDMTRLVSAQRHSAWREVARRIAHEIKNPLTPIQLSAERLLKKYSKEIKSDPDVFQNCTQTIIRQVNSLEQMVDEFSAFARMPAPNYSPVDFKALVSDILFAQRVSFPDIKFDVLIHKANTSKIMCDERLITQALTNIYKNAGESILRRIDEIGIDSISGKINTIVKYDEEFVTISIFDNGTGWPAQDKDRLLEPYVTTRDSGTGLGLAIVKRIAEDHGGNLILNYRTDNKPGALVEISIQNNSTNRNSNIDFEVN